VPFVSDADLEAALDEAHVSNRASKPLSRRIGRLESQAYDMPSRFWLCSPSCALFTAQRIPTTQPAAKAA
jgi:hypothetical protein